MGRIHEETDNFAHSFQKNMTGAKSIIDRSFLLGFDSISAICSDSSLDAIVLTIEGCRPEDSNENTEKPFFGLSHLASAPV